MFDLYRTIYLVSLKMRGPSRAKFDGGKKLTTSLVMWFGSFNFILKDKPLKTSASERLHRSRGKFTHMFPKPWAYQGFTNDLWYIVCQPNWMEPSRHPLGPHYVQSIGAAEAVSLAIGHNAGRVVTLTQYTTMLVLIFANLRRMTDRVNPTWLCTHSTAEWDLNSGSSDSKPPPQPPPPTPPPQPGSQHQA